MQKQVRAMLTKEEEDQEYLEELSAEAEQAEQAELLAQVSAHAVQGTATANSTSILHIKVGQIDALALVDTGSTGTFIDSNFALKNGCKVKGARPMCITVANGQEMLSKAACVDYQFSIQGNTFRNDFRLLQLKGYDIILGTDWMLTHSPVTWDYRKEALTINYYGIKQLIFSADSATNTCSVIQADKLPKLLQQEMLEAILYAVPLAQENVDASPAPMEIAEVLQ
jgi:hypothetical protein